MIDSVISVIGTVRQAAYLYFLTWVMGAQLVFVLLWLGVPLPGPNWLLALLFGLWPIAMTTAWWKKLPSRSAGVAPSPSPRVLLWTLAGLLAYGYWAASYFLVAAMVDAEHAHVLMEFPFAQVSLAPLWSLVYLGVHPFCVTPCLALQDERVLRRHVIGQLVIVALSSLVWVLYPVVVRRLALPAPKDAPDFGVWVLAALYGRDPTVNCLPSTHCAMAIYAAVAIARVDRRLAVWAVVSAVLIGASTLFTQEHYFLDVITGYLLGGAAAFIVHAEQPAL